jgi:hypothetical protein
MPNIMNTVKKIAEEIRYLPETQAREVLDFVGYLKSKLKQADKTSQNVDDFDQFGTVFDGQFNREECYDRQNLS